MATEAIDIVMPVHNEAESIEATLREFYQIVAVEQKTPIRFVICEDGSKDRTVDVLKHLAKELPILLITGPERKGYSRAVVDGFLASTSKKIGFIDSDGQCDPRDFAAFKKVADQADLVIGFRNPRSDHWIRLTMSKCFATVYRLLFPVQLKDPSCPYLLIERKLLLQILDGEVGILKQGFWWEFFARAIACKANILEIPVKHRVRSAGQTQVYRVTNVPRIAYEHLLGLLKLRKELKNLTKTFGKVQKTV